MTSFFLELECDEVESVFAFFSKTTRWICAKFFSGFRKKHLFMH